MGLLRSKQQPQNYLKVMKCTMLSVPNTYNAELPVDRLPARVEFTVTYRIFESYNKRVEWDTNKFVVSFEETRTVNFIPQLPQGWEPVTTNLSDIEEEKAIVMGYVALGTLAEFSEWENYQPEIVL